MALGQAMHVQTDERLVGRHQKGIASLSNACNIRREPLAVHEPCGHRKQGTMLSIYGNSSGRFCAGASRRNFLKLGGLGMGSLALPELLRASVSSDGGKREKSIIMTNRLTLRG